MASENLTLSLREILAREGGYVDHPRDPGGATNMGITRKTLARWRSTCPWWALPKSEVRAIKTGEAKAIYKANYWDRIAANALPSGLDLALFDFAVNSGPVRAVKTLQRELAVRMDGAVGPVTLKALQGKIAEIGVAALIRAVCGARLSFLQRLVTFATFGKGWEKRVALIQRIALKLANVDPNFAPQPRKIDMNILSGYKTYILGVIMLLAGIGQLLGLDLPGFDGQTAGNLIMEGFGLIFLRKGIKTEIGNA